MPKFAILTALLCCSIILTSCSSKTETEGKLPDFTNPIPDESRPTQEDTISSEDNTELYTGTLSWDLRGLTVEDRMPSVLDNFEGQRLFSAAADDRDMFCVARTQHYAEDIGLELAFTQFVGESGGEFISLNDFDAPNGAGKQYLSLRTIGESLVNTIGEFYYFPANQLTYSLNTMFNLYCYSLANLYASNEVRMNDYMGAFEFNTAIELENLLDEDWTNLGSMPTDNFSRIRLRNRTNQQLEAFWIDFDGNREPLSLVNAGQALGLSSYEGNLIVVLDAARAVVGQFRAIATDSIAVIR